MEMSNIKGWTEVHRNKIEVLIVAALTIPFMWVLTEFAMAQTELESAIESAATEVQTTVTSLLPTILGVAAFLLVVSIAWKFFRRFVR
jgi:hypothetical protein